MVSRMAKVMDLVLLMNFSDIFIVQHWLLKSAWVHLLDREHRAFLCLCLVLDEDYLSTPLEV